MPQYTVNEEVELLTDAGLLTEQQARAYVLRFVEGFELTDAAGQMDLAKATVSQYASDAAAKVDAAEETLAALEAIDTIPDACEKCGATLGGRYVTDREGRALCMDCGGTDGS